MKAALRIKLAWTLALTAAACFHCAAQAPDVPICTQAPQGSQDKTKLLNAAKTLYDTGDALTVATVKRQLRRTSCQLALPEASTQKLPGREICIAARHSHLRVGWTYLCPKCGKWHISLAGAYALTTDGAVATCFHVVEPGTDVKEGCLVAVNGEGTVLPVAEVLAANRDGDACIVRIAGHDFTPLPLNTNVYPGDVAYCYSDPVEHRDYFSAGIVNRFYQRSGARSAGVRTTATAGPTRINVSTDWAPGSSGSAVLDDCGNAIGHVSTISAFRDESAPKAQDSHAEKPTEIVFHEAVSARDVLRLVRPLK